MQQGSKGQASERVIVRARRDGGPDILYPLYSGNDIVEAFADTALCSLLL